MKLIGHRFWDSRWLLGGFVVFIALSLILGGLNAMMGGRPAYRNYWGGVIFAPFAIVLGTAILVVFAVNWRSLNELGRPLKGKAARRARQAERARSAVETFDEPWKGGRA